ncbi:flagellar biosynthesis protein FlhA [Paraburkholderia sp. HC6.4b]|uniref:flagellar biosynthesis protein FlhA n=1 Tax=unclassified Paraburkholderia TaxID=2615204 RepID=UPI001617EE7E|nr:MULTISPECIES: flagellar biosynthesis protein FlhA [unclassified Paraburkholderia]MBB5407668.1 flagellar biosynthesis protein FlhA [Paraburkholderia sp. HC6.4b]MBB5452319.1 flagellar biosynthesis protein FlhA [Paraburkholderia sp. Kb1A]
MTLRSRLRNHSDLALVFAVVAILLLLFTPIPAGALDLFIIVNFAFAFTILLMTFYVSRPVEFSTFPSLLLIATLFRLSLNIAATRLILSGAEAGQVIAAIGAFVVQGNFVIGLIVFFILIVVQYVVVTTGAQRVSEVAARFVLDAMPGQQMSIDADLNMGLIDQDEAKRRRKALEKEAGFYGSMDGASKFVKGDAVAGIMILLIDILGGWAVGVAQMGMPLSQAMQTFTLLTIGDGIVTQVPALIISVATGIIVTRSSADGELGNEVLRQLVQFPKIQILVMVALTGLLALPGMPKWPVLILATIAGGAWWIARRKRSAAPDNQAATDGDDSDAAAATQATDLPAVEVSFGAALTAAWIPTQSLLAERIAAFRKQYAAEMGVSIPPVVFRDGAQLGSNDYRILLFGDRFGQATLYPEKTLAIHSSDKGEKVPGIATHDPAFGLPAVWIDTADLSRARSLGYTAVDPLTVLITHVTEVIKANVPALLSRTEVVAMLEGVRSRTPGLVEELVPNVLAVSDVQHVLQNLLTEQVAIRNIGLIVEVLVDAGRHEKDPAALSERVRQRLGHGICQAIQSDHDALAVLTLDPALENAIVQNLQGADGAGAFVLDPRLAESFLARLAAQVDAMMRQNLKPALLCRPEIRRHLKTFTHRVAPRLAVLSMNEVPHSISLRSFAMVSLDATAARAPARAAQPSNATALAA